MYWDQSKPVFFQKIVIINFVSPRRSYECERLIRTSYVSNSKAARRTGLQLALSTPFFNKKGFQSFLIKNCLWTYDITVSKKCSVITWETEPRLFWGKLKVYEKWNYILFNIFKAPTSTIVKHSVQYGRSTWAIKNISGNISKMLKLFVIIRL